MTLRNLFKGLLYQFRKKGWYRNFFITRNAWGLFSKHSHINKNGTAKVTYNTEASAIKAADSMSRKALKKENKEVHYSTYKCIYCDGFHIGRNRDNSKDN